MAQLLDSRDLDAKADAIVKRMHAYLDAGNRVFTTSSFQTQSLPLLHMISRVNRDIPVYYTSTGFLFPDTIRFAEQLADTLKLNVVALRPDVPKIKQMDRAGRLLYASDPDYCCYLNKVQPLEPVLQANDVWINGVRSDQSDVRAAMQQEEPARHGCLRYHPMLDWDARSVFYYRRLHDLPEHPMEASGYLSIGCEPCTSKAFGEGNARNARWFGMNKTECGLNTTLVSESH
ncbi:phosphoadenylyl-sulfate reductase [Chromatocurvus halotolerans]|uniref:Adenosine 5'-phosphosulfate reductase n=1 Tax=Chromatocurvus halotolerans TaxID=1132028 RepID=A0A4R2KLC9_9GAMM|nr:phosphoadenylyl-sulfate reductase [Chromatocurvus halotolerans]TCO74473.1 phosphoadenylylsulfate reductase (thioredoxin) [Chromatocurvus halotolerans]